MQTGFLNSALAVGILTSTVTIIGVIAGYWLSTRLQKEQFRRTSRKEEYRNLLDVLGSCVLRIIELKNHVYSPNTLGSGSWGVMNNMSQRMTEVAEVEQQLDSALLAASQALDDRLFISDAIADRGVNSDWTKMIEMARRPLRAQSKEQAVFNSDEFSRAWRELAKKIRTIAREDV